MDTDRGVPVMESIVLQYGLAGVVIIALTAAVRILYQRNNDLQEKRIADLKEITEKSNTTIDGLKDMISELKDALSKNKRGN
jgi:cell division protein FtsL